MDCTGHFRDKSTKEVGLVWGVQDVINNTGNFDWNRSSGSIIVAVWLFVNVGGYAICFIDTLCASIFIVVKSTEAALRGTVEFDESDLSRRVC